MSMEFDGETGEILGDRADYNSIEHQSDARETLSQRATNGMKPPGYWDKRQGVMKTTGNQWFASALLKVQAEIAPIIDADANNPFHKSKYTTLGMLLSKIRPLLKEHELIIKQGAGKIFSHGTKEQRYFLPVFMEIVHAPTCESERVLVEIPLTKVDPQAIGVAITYGRRYLLLSYFGIASMDDDAASAVQKRLDKDEEAEAVAGIVEKIKQCSSVDELNRWAKMNRDALGALSDEKVAKLRTSYEERLRELQEANPEGNGKAKK